MCSPSDTVNTFYHAATKTLFRTTAVILTHSTVANTSFYTALSVL